MEQMIRFAENDGFAEHLGIELLEVSQGRARARMEIGKQHLNSLHTVHGGAIFSLADSVFAIASNSHGTIAMAINVSISYLKAVEEGVLVAEANEVSLNSKLATYTVRVTDAGDELVALFQGMVYRKRETLDMT